MRKIIQSSLIDEDGAWLYLNPGYQLDGVHSIHEDTMTQAKARLGEVSKCTCEECKRDLKGA